MSDTIQQQILSYFPPKIHPLTLVSDPDLLLSNGSMMLELKTRGFFIIQEDDPVLFRHQIEEIRPFQTHNFIIVITTHQLEELPYDIYQMSYRLSLSLHQFFPHLSYPILQTLTPDQIEKLGHCILPDEAQSRQKTIDFILQQVFDAKPNLLIQPPELIHWLDDYHQNKSILPEILRTNLGNSMKQYEVYRDWDIDLLVSDSQAFSEFIQKQWKYSLNQLTGRQIHELGQEYQLAFSEHSELQDLLPSLVRHGRIKPLELSNKDNLPKWVLPGITLSDSNLQRFEILIDDLEKRIGTKDIEREINTDWIKWKSIAEEWAEISHYYFLTIFHATPEHKAKFQKLVRSIDGQFVNWLKDNYTPLGVLRLPVPHHVFHMPHYLAYLKNSNKLDKVVLLILDGFSLLDWQEVMPVWEKRNPDWRVKTDTLLAQVPTITSISRYALISGLRPTEFAFDLDHIPSENRAWELFWSREGIPSTQCKLMSLNFDRGIDHIPDLNDPRINFWCLIDDTPDKLAHNATLGTKDQQSSLRLWLDQTNENNSIQIENLISSFLNRGYSVFITSDHGHVEGIGFGQPSEGLIAQTRGKRARIYSDHLAANRVQDAFPETILWEHDDLLPNRFCALMPQNRNAFTKVGEVVVTHGGITIDEAIVPFITITEANS